MERQDIETIFNWFGYKKTSKLTGISVSKLYKMKLESNRQKDTVKNRKHISINANLKPTHMLDFGTLAKKSLFDANKHKRTIGLTFGILKNLSTKRVYYLLSQKNESSKLAENLINSAIASNEEIKVLRIDNQLYRSLEKKFSFKLQIVPKSTTKPYNSNIEREIGRIQKTIQRNWKRISKLKEAFELETIISALCHAVFEDNITNLLKLVTHAKSLETNKIKQVVKIRNG